VKNKRKEVFRVKTEELKNKFSFLEAEESTKRIGNNEKGILTIVNTEHHGKRLMISKQLEKDLKLEGKIQIAVANDGTCMLVGSLIEKNQNTFTLNRLKKGSESSRYVLYNKAVIDEITEKLKLDFSSKTTITFYGIEYMEYGDTTIAKVWLGGEL